MKNKFSVYLSIIVALFLAFIISCKKDFNDEYLKNPAASTSAISFNRHLAYGTMTDQEGNTYKTITIGSQTWMAENLRTTKYRNLNDIRYITDSIEWSLRQSGAYCNYKNDTIYGPIYGRLYNWYAVTDSRNIAPEGWHVPSDSEWQTLILYLDANADFSSDWGLVSIFAGGKLKETGIHHWFTPNLGATNSSGFTALPGGARDAYSGFELSFAGKSGVWWTSTQGDYGCFYYDLSTFNGGVYRAPYPRTSGFSVRCIKD